MTPVLLNFSVALPLRAVRERMAVKAILYQHRFWQHFVVINCAGRFDADSVFRAGLKTIDLRSVTLNVHLTISF